MSLFSKPDTHSVLLIDIASSSVGIGLSGIREGALPELVFTARVPFAYRKDFDIQHLEQAMLFALREVLGVAHREGPRLLMARGFPVAPNHAVISFSSPWYASALGENHAAFRSALEEKYGSAEVFESEGGLMSAVEKRLVKKIEEEVIRAFGIREGIGLSSFTFSFSRVARHAFSGLDPALFIDMTGHMTDVLGFSGGRYQRNVSIPVGTHALKREPGVPWDDFWQKLSGEHTRGFEKSNVFLIADDYDLARLHLSAMLPEARIISFGARGGFIDEMVNASQGLTPVERLAILATYTNLFF